MQMIKTLFWVILCIAVTGCAGLDSLEPVTVDKTQQLAPGMSHEKVIAILGQPKSVQFIGDKVVLKYKLLEYYKGWVPYYMIFEKKSATLVSWYANEAEYQQNQMMWMNVFNAFEESMQDSQPQGGSGQGSGSGQGGAGYNPSSNYYTGEGSDPNYDSSACWASAGCTGYDSDTGTYTQEQYDYNTDSYIQE